MFTYMTAEIRYAVMERVMRFLRGISQLPVYFPDWALVEKPRNLPFVFTSPIFVSKYTLFPSGVALIP
jgi:hypothetical protein